MNRLFIALILLVPCIVFSQLDRSVVPSAMSAKEISIPDPVVFKTANGITVILSENHKLPRVSFSLTVGNGQRLEGKKAGLSSLAGDLILSGTETQNKDEMDAKIDYIGARLIADHESMYLSCLSKHMDVGLSVLSDALLNANFPQSEFDRIVKQARSAFQAQKSSAESMGHNALMSVLFDKHPYGEIPNEATLDQITRDDVVRYFKTQFVPENSYLVIVGDITKEKTEEIVNKYFSAWSGKSQPKVDYPVKDKLPDTRVIFVNKTGAVQSYIQVAVPAKVSFGDANYLPLRMVDAILGGGVFSNRLTQNLREDKGYTYSPNSDLSIRPQGSYMSFEGSFRNEVTDSAITELLYELERITDSYVDDEELSVTKSVMTGQFARSLEQPSTIARFALQIERYNLDKDYYKNYLKNMEAIDKEQILETAQRFITPKNCFIIVVGNESELAKIEKFDTDGKIEKLDAFGQVVEDRKPADISAQELFKRHSFYVTNSKTEKERDKKIKKIKSYKIEVEMNIEQVPMPLQATFFWAAPNSEVSMIHMQGMTLMKVYYDGTTGYIADMQGGKKEISTNELAAKKKSSGFVPELNYTQTGMEYELLGIENIDNKDMYVVKLNDGEGEKYEYYDANTYAKLRRIEIMTDPESGNSDTQTVFYDDYREVNGVMLPYVISLSMGEALFAGKAMSVVVNKGSISDYK